MIQACEDANLAIHVADLGETGYSPQVSNSLLLLIVEINIVHSVIVVW